MAISIPSKIENDLESRNTRLIPVVKINSIYLSTTTATLETDSGNVITTIPLLLSIPDLRESIDIQTRKYKINNFTLNISNYEYKSKRFSDLQTDSLINKRVDVYWVSQSVEKISEALHIYIGYVRDYKHNSDKCMISVEDQSQQLFHKNLPSNNLSSEAHVPIKDKNKPYPMVYGVVKNSPLQITHDPHTGAKEGQITPSYSADKSSQVKIRTNRVKMYENNKYHIVPEKTSTTIEAEIPIVNASPMLMTFEDQDQITQTGGSTNIIYFGDVSMSAELSSATPKFFAENLVVFQSLLTPTSKYTRNNGHQNEDLQFTHRSPINLGGANSTYIPGGSKTTNKVFYSTNTYIKEEPGGFKISGSLINDMSIDSWKWNYNVEGGSEIISDSTLTPEQLQARRWDRQTLGPTIWGPAGMEQAPDDIQFMPTGELVDRYRSMMQIHLMFSPLESSDIIFNDLRLKFKQKMLVLNCKGQVQYTENADQGDPPPFNPSTTPPSSPFGVHTKHDEMHFHILEGNKYVIYYVIDHDSGENFYNASEDSPMIFRTFECGYKTTPGESWTAGSQDHLHDTFHEMPSDQSNLRGPAIWMRTNAQGDPATADAPGYEEDEPARAWGDFSEDHVHGVTSKGLKLKNGREIVMRYSPYSFWGSDRNLVNPVQGMEHPIDHLFGRRHWGFECEFKDLYLSQTSIVKNANQKRFFADVEGRIVYEPYLPHIITHILANEIYDEANNKLTGYNYFQNDGKMENHETSIYDTLKWKYEFTINESKTSKKIFEELSSVSPYIPRFNNMGQFKFDIIPKDDTNLTEDHTIIASECIDFTFRKSNISEVYTKIILHHGWDYAEEKFTTTTEISLNNLPGITDATVGQSGEVWAPAFYGFSDYNAVKEEENGYISSTTLVIDDERGKYIPAEHLGTNISDTPQPSKTARGIVAWLLSWHCNQHLIIKAKLSVKWIKLEIGDIVKFDKRLGGINPYNQAEDGAVYAGYINGSQRAYEYFIITSTVKKIDFIEIEAIQLHQLYTDDDTDRPYKLGCTDPYSCNYDPLATNSNNTCIYPHSFCLDEFSTGIGSTAIGWEKFCDPGTMSDYQIEQGELQEVPDPVEGGGQWLDGSVEGNCQECAGAGFGCDDVCGSGLEFDDCGAGWEGSCGGTSVCFDDDNNVLQDLSNCPCAGCTDPSFQTYNENATVDDGSCYNMGGQEDLINTDLCSHDGEMWDTNQYYPDNFYEDLLPGWRLANESAFNNAGVGHMGVIRINETERNNNNGIEKHRPNFCWGSVQEKIDEWYECDCGGTLGIDPQPGAPEYNCDNYPPMILSPGSCKIQSLNTVEYFNISEIQTKFINNSGADVTDYSFVLKVDDPCNPILSQNTSYINVPAGISSSDEMQFFVKFNHGGYDPNGATIIPTDVTFSFQTEYAIINGPNTEEGSGALQWTSFSSGLGEHEVNLELVPAGDDDQEYLSTNLLENYEFKIEADNIAGIWNDAIDYIAEGNTMEVAVRFQIIMYTSVPTGGYESVVELYNGTFILTSGEAGQEIIPGCRENDACNYDPNANYDDGSCVYPAQAEITPGIIEDIFDCNGNCLHLTSTGNPSEECINACLAESGGMVTACNACAIEGTNYEYPIVCPDGGQFCPQDEDGYLTQCEHDPSSDCNPIPGANTCGWKLGDLNQDGGYNVLDIVTLANCVLAGTCPFLGSDDEDSIANFSCAADLNQDGGFNVLDIVTLANCILEGNCDELNRCVNAGLSWQTSEGEDLLCNCPTCEDSSVGNYVTCLAGTLHEGFCMESYYEDNRDKDCVCEGKYLCDGATDCSPNICSCSNQVLCPDNSDYPGECKNTLGGCYDIDE